MIAGHGTPTITVEFTFTEAELNDILGDLKAVQNDPNEELEAATDELIKALGDAQHAIGGYGGD